MKSTPPMLPGSPIVGNLLEFLKDRDGLFQHGLNSIGPVFGIKLANQPVAVLIGPDHQQIFFMETDKKLSMHKTYKFLKAALGEVGFTGPPHIYNEQRPILHKPFKGERAISSINVMQSEVQQWIDTLGDEGEMELTSEINSLVQNVASHALMGRDFRQKAGREFWDQYLIIGKAIDPVFPPYLPFPRFIRRDIAKNKLRATLRPIIAERRANPEKYDDFLQDFVNARYKDGRAVEDETILSLILALMFAGHETTSGQAAWTIVQLLQNPEYLALINQEIAEKLPIGQELDGRRLGSLRHIYWAVQETSRMHPSADMLLRRAEEDIEIGGYVIPEGWNLIISPGVAHRLPSIFTKPEQYDPLRFSPERAEDKKHRFTMVGFGGGIHKCAGMNFANNEMMVITALLFQQFDLELITKDPKVNYGMGANRPDKTIIRYRRKAQNTQITPEPVTAGDKLA